MLPLLLGGCGTQISFEKVDYQGHVRIESEGQGYCYHVPKDWEIREALEDSDVVCMAPDGENVRDSIVSSTVSAAEIGGDPVKFVASQLEELGSSVTVLQEWSRSDSAASLILDDSSFSTQPLAQFIYLHVRPNGDGVLIACTTHKDKLEERREFFHNIVSKTNYNIEECEGVGGIPKVFPTPEVTFSPAP